MIEEKILKEAKLRIEKILNYSTDEHNIFTPWKLCIDMLNSVEINDKHDVLVIANLEFIFLLNKRLGSLNNIWFMTPCETKEKTAVALGVNPKHIIKMTYNLKDLNGMKFDYVIMNPPYNPNAIWSKFVELGMDLIKDDGKMIAIHPATWRESTKYKKLADRIKNGISELHINDYNYFKIETEGLRTDWYVWQKGYDGVSLMTYSNGDVDKLDLRKTEWLLRIPMDSIPARILKKITSNKKHNKLIVEKGHDPLYKQHDSNGRYKQCGLAGNGTGWCNGNFGLTNKPSKHQFESKVVICYVGHLRAHFFSKNDAVGVLRANYWLTDNESLPLLLNSKMIWKLLLELFDPGGKKQRWDAGTIMFFQSLNFENLNVTSEEELYQHYKLTEEEIQWIQL